MRNLAACLLAAVILSGPVPARADTPEARGNRLFAAKKYADAVTAFREAANQPGRVGYDFSCEIGLSYAGLGEHARAHFYLGLCSEGETWARWKKRAQRARAAAEVAMAASQFAKVRVEVTPADAIARFDVLDDVGFSVPREVWLPLGSHTLSAHADGYQGVEQQVILYGRDPVTVSIDLKPTKVQPTDSETENVDFAEEEPFEETAAGDLPKVKHDTLMPKRFRGGGVWRGGNRGPSSRLSVGFELGPSLSQLLGADAPDAGGRIGLSAFVFLSYRITGSLMLRPELGWMRKGAEAHALDYAVVPVLVAYARRIGPLSGRLAAGPALGFSLGSEIAGAEVAAFELSAIASAGVRFPCGVVVEIRYAHGLTTVDGGSPAGEISTSALSVLGGYTF